MTNLPPEPSHDPTLGGSSRAPEWWWRLNAADGSEVEPADGRELFPARGDAESWVGEFWQDLAADGVASVTLFEGDREVYGPMSLDTA